MNYKYADTILLTSLRRHVRACGDTKHHLYYYEYSMLTMNVMSEEIIDHRLDDTFQFELSSSLFFNKVDASNNINYNNNNFDRYVSEMQPSAY